MPGGDAARARVELDPVAAEARAVREPGALEHPRRVGRAAHDERALTRAVVRGDVLHADERRFGPAERRARAPRASAVARRAAPGGRSCSPRGTAGCRRGRGSARRRRSACCVTYSAWPGKTTRSYARAKSSPLADVSRSSSDRKSTCLPVRFSQAMKSRSQSRKRNGTPKSRNGRARSTLRVARAHVPAVAPAVPVCVPEVVRLPRVRREDDRDPRLRRRAPDDERRVPESPVRGLERAGSRARSASRRLARSAEAPGPSRCARQSTLRARHRRARGLEVAAPHGVAGSSSGRPGGGATGASVEILQVGLLARARSCASGTPPRSLHADDRRRRRSPGRFM